MTQFLSPKDLDEIKIGKDLLTADGDLITRQAGNVIALPTGTQGQVLTVGLTSVPEWADPLSGGSNVSFGTIMSDATQIDALEPGDTLNLVSGANITLTPNVGNKSITIAATAVEGTASNSFATISAVGNNSTASSDTDTFTFEAGTNIGLTHTAGSKQITIATSGVATSMELTTHINDTNLPHGATTLNTPVSIVARDVSGNFSANQITASSFNGTATNATQLGGVAASNYSQTSHTHPGYASSTDLSNHTGAMDGHGAVSANTASRIVMRDASGNFSAGTITASLNGTASNATNAGYATSAGSVAWSSVTSKPTTVSGYGITDAVSTSTLSTHTGATGVGTHGATVTNTPNALVIRDASGNFSAGIITASLSGNASTATMASNSTQLGGYTASSYPRIRHSTGSTNYFCEGVNIVIQDMTTSIAAGAEVSFFFPLTYSYVAGAWMVKNTYSYTGPLMEYLSIVYLDNTKVTIKNNHPSTTYTDGYSFAVVVLTNYV